MNGLTGRDGGPSGPRSAASGGAGAATGVRVASADGPNRPGGPEHLPADPSPAADRVPPEHGHFAATDTTGEPGVDALGWPAEGSVRAVVRAIQAGAPVTLRVTGDWPLPAFPPNVSAPVRAEAAAGPGAHRGLRDGIALRPDTRPHAETDAAPAPEASWEPAGARGAAHRAPAEPAEPRPELWVTDELVAPGPGAAVLRPPSLTVGIGAGVGVGSGEVIGLVERVLHGAGLSLTSVAELATADAKAGEPGLLSAADRLRLPLRTYSARVLAAVDVPNPSQRARAALGTPSVAEAAALAAAGEGAQLVVPKARSEHRDGGPAMATAAVARRGRHGRLTAEPGAGPSGGEGRDRGTAAARTAQLPAPGPPRRTGTASKENQ